ncbi:MAG: DEAD/DEAH box helicase [Thermoflexaceae bacterium]|nr:DEAD/DEAH box helicase [Thermoflexaceae bacterium]
MVASDRPPALSFFSPVAREWFNATFARPTRAQETGWNAIASGEHTLLLAPTGSGKTLAAFLWCLDRLATRPAPPSTRGVSVLYVSPLKALSYDIERNLRAPLAGLRIAAAREGLPAPGINIAIRTGDTPSREREDIRRNPPDILITTPESLYLMLTSRAREILRTVETVIVDEIHTMAGTKRGAHLALSLERLEHLAGRPFQRIGLSATQRPLDEVAKYLGGDRPVRIVDAGASRELDLAVIVPVEDMSRPAENEIIHGPSADGRDIEARSSVWPAIYPRLLELVRAHRSSLIFVNNRRLAERLAARLNDLAGEELVLTHHGSMSRDQRTLVEERLKEGTLPGLVCTSSLELGIDMGAVDLVIQVESPKSVSRGLQRVGRAGHRIDLPSTGRIFPKFRGDLLECAVLTQRMRDGLIESTVVPRNPLDVLAQQVVAMCAMEDWQLEELERVVRRAYSFSGLGREALEGVLGMLAGQYPSDEFADLRPRITWDRETNLLSGRRDAKPVAIVNAGTIPDRGLYGVFLGEQGPRVGELDEEMVYESRPGEVFILGASSWRIDHIGRDRVIVSPAPGQPGKLPFWKGDGVGRPLEFGRAIGAFTRELGGLPESEASARLAADHGLDDLAARNLLAYLAEQKEATGALPTDRTIVVERFLDELGDWRVVILTPFGGRVHAPWALAIEALLARRSGFDIQTIWSDDGIAVRFAEGDELPPDSCLFPGPEEVEDLVVEQLASSALFASHFRENAARALLLPRHRPGSRTPLWAQRLRSANLLAVASRYGSFPIVLETYRECLRDVFDLPGLVEVLTAVRNRTTRVAHAQTGQASPFARSLLFDWVAAYMYEGDAPLAERRAQALTLDRALLRDLLGDGDLRELLDPDAIDETEELLQCLAGSRRARNPDQLHDLLRQVGDLALHEIKARAASPGEVQGWLAALEHGRRACPIRIAGEERWIAIEDAGRYRDALGANPPLGVPEAFLKPAAAALQGLLGRYARTHGPFVAAGPAGRWALPEALVLADLRALEDAGAVLHGDFRPGGAGREWCDPGVLRTLRRRSLARLRREVEPVDGAAAARFLIGWHGIGSDTPGLERLREVLAQLEGLPLPASVLEREILASRVRDYQPRMLDELCAAGEFAWAGRGPLGRDDGRVAFFRRERLPLLAPAAAGLPGGEVHAAILGALRGSGALFFSDLVGAARAPLREVLDALWDLVWAGFVTNDTFGPVRALAWPRKGGSAPSRGRGALVPPEAAGRWSLVAAPAATSTERAHALAGALLERYGVVTRETAATEGLPGGFSAVYPVLKAMEESGRVRRGYFIEGLGGAQFALPGAVDRLRAGRDAPRDESALVLAATDPANPYGATLGWPQKEASSRNTPQRAAGARVVLVSGEPILYLERSGKGLLTLPAADDPGRLALAISALLQDPAILNGRSFTIERIDGEPAAGSPHAAALLGAGFVPGYRGMVFRPRREGPVSSARRG